MLDTENTKALCTGWCSKTTYRDHNNNTMRNKCHNTPKLQHTAIRQCAAIGFDYGFFHLQLLLFSSSSPQQQNRMDSLDIFVRSRNIAVHYYYYNMLYHHAGLFKTAEAINDSKVIVKRAPRYESFLIYARGRSVGYSFHPLPSHRSAIRSTSGKPGCQTFIEW